MDQKTIHVGISHLDKLSIDAKRNKMLVELRQDLNAIVPSFACSNE
jgi:hypothetical protein